jgi:hypothetical protein
MKTKSILIENQKNNCIDFQFRNWLTYCVIIFALIVLIPFAVADSPPSVPIRFDGSVAINGEPVEDGTIVSVNIGDFSIDTDTIESRYSIQVPSTDGEEYVFYVAGFEAGRHRVLAPGSYIPFNLIIIDSEVDNSNDDSGDDSNGDYTGNSGNNGGSSSGGSSGTSSFNVLTEEYQSFQISVSRGKSFQFDDEKHVITVDAVSGNTAKINIDSEELILTVYSGEIKEIDLDSDSDYLLNLNAESVSGLTANLLLKQVARPESVIEEEKKETGDIIETESVIEEQEDNSFAAITGAFAGLPDLSILQNIYLIIAVFIIVIVLLFVYNKSANNYLRIALRKVLRGSDDNKKK